MARVLIVDDTEILRRAMEMVIRRMGHTPISAATPRKAYELALADPPDLALIDLLMPEMDGAELFRRLRGALGERCPAVIFVSASPPEEVARRVLPVGSPAGYVTKPFCVDDLSGIVAGALAGRSAAWPVDERRTQAANGVYARVRDSGSPAAIPNRALV